MQITLNKPLDKAAFRTHGVMFFRGYAQYPKPDMAWVCEHMREVHTGNLPEAALAETRRLTAACSAMLS